MEVCSVLGLLVELLVEAMAGFSSWMLFTNDWSTDTIRPLLEELSVVVDIFDLSGGVPNICGHLMVHG